MRSARRFQTPAADEFEDGESGEDEAAYEERRSSIDTLVERMRTLGQM
jgi:hypothetical protein